MASLDLIGFDELADAMIRISEVPWDVMEKSLNAMAAVAADKIRATGESMGVRDPESKVHILDKIKPAKARRTRYGGMQKITFSGSRKRGDIRTRNAEIAYVNEYGKRSQTARPFILTAMESNADEISDAGEKIFGDWTEKEFVRD